MKQVRAEKESDALHWQQQAKENLDKLATEQEINCKQAKQIREA